MKKVVLFAVATVIASGIMAQKPIAIGTKAPMMDYKMKDVSGNSISLKDATKDKGVLVMFSCNTCPYVLKNQERTKLVSEFALEHQVGVIIINSNEDKRGGDDSYSSMKSYAKEQGYKWFYTVDENSKLADAFGANRTPEVFLLDASGTVVYKGAIDDNPADAANVKKEFLKEAITELSVGKSITRAETKSVGCTIKRKA